MTTREFGFRRGGDIYLRCQYIRGYLGGAGAIPCLDTLIRRVSLSENTIDAIGLLAQAGVYDYFETLVEGLGRPELTFYCLNGLRLYANSPEFGEHAVEIMMELAQDDGAKEEDRFAALLMTEEIDKKRSAQVLMSWFERESDEEIRNRLFGYADDIDRDVRPDMSVLAIPDTKSEYLRLSYLPSLYSIRGDSNTSGWMSRRYLRPSYVAFLLDWQHQEPSGMLRNHISDFLEEFIPLPPPDSVSLNQMVVDLIQITSEVSGYTWIGNGEFVNALDTCLHHAQGSLASGDFKQSVEEMRRIQNDLAKAYGSPTDSRYATKEGYKYLFRGAQYVIARIEGKER